MGIILDFTGMASYVSSNKEYNAGLLLVVREGIVICRGGK